MLDADRHAARAELSSDMRLNSPASLMGASPTRAASTRARMDTPKAVKTAAKAVPISKDGSLSGGKWA